MPIFEHGTPAPTQHHELHLNDVVEVGLEDIRGVNLPTIMNQQTIAELSLGGVMDEASGSPVNSEVAYLLRVTNPKDPDYQELKARAQASGTEPSDYILMATEDRGNGTLGVTAAAFLNHEESFSVIGRQGTVKWFDYGMVKPGAGDPATRTPFWFNDSVSRHQIRITTSDRGVTMDGLSTKSRTGITAPDMTVKYVHDRSKSTGSASGETRKPQQRVRALGKRVLAVGSKLGN